MKHIQFVDKPEIPVSHEDPNDPGVVKRVLLTEKDEINGAILMLNWATLLPGRSVRVHAHQSMKEIFIMMNDGVEAVVDGKHILLRRGDVLVVDSLESHEFTNTTQTPIEYLAMGVAK